MHSVNFSFNLKLSIQKHKYSLPHFPSNHTNTKADTERERERENQAQILSNLQKPNETKIEQIFHRDCKIHRARCNPCFSKSFSRETNRSQGGRERVVTWWTREEKSDWMSRRRSSDPSSSSSSTSLHRSSSFSENLRSFFISEGFENVPPLFHSGGVGRSGC